MLNFKINPTKHNLMGRPDLIRDESKILDPYPTHFFTFHIRSIQVQVGSGQKLQPPSLIGVVDKKLWSMWVNGDQYSFCKIES